MRHQLTGLLILSSLAGCAADPAVTEDGNGLPPTQTLVVQDQDKVASLATDLALTLAIQYQGGYQGHYLAVATPVMVTDYRKSDRFSRQLETSLLTALHQQGFRLVEVNGSGVMRVSDQGNHYLSRQYQDLANVAPVAQLVVSTVDPGRNRIWIQARILDIANQRVLSVAERSVPWEDLAGYYSPSGRLGMKDGKLVRYEKPGMGPLIPLESQ